MNATNTLFGTEVRRRPRETDPDVIRDAVNGLMECAKHYNIDIADMGGVEAIRDDVSEAIRERDGYRAARYLDNRGWEIDSDIVDWLNDVDLWGAESRATAAWVAAEGIVPALAVGAAVRVRRPFGSKGSEFVDGEISDIDAKHAKYTVRVAELGHVKTGLGTHGIILPFEQVETRDASGQ